jgi:hypothetical protein
VMIAIMIVNGQQIAILKIDAVDKITIEIVIKIVVDSVYAASFMICRKKNFRGGIVSENGLCKKLNYIYDTWGIRDSNNNLQG